jgi:hypothetical protein
MSTTNRLCRAPLHAGLVLVLTTGSLTAQAPPQPPIPPTAGVPAPGRRAVVPAGIQPGQAGSFANTIPILSQNYQVKLAIKSGDDAETVEVLTASPTVSFNCVLGKSPSTLITFSGTLQEGENGSLVLQYSVGGRVPVVIESPAPPAGAGGVVRGNQIEYKDETSTGAIHVTTGSEQTLLKSGGRSYHILIVPAPKPQ